MRKLFIRFVKKHSAFFHFLFVLLFSTLMLLVQSFPSLSSSKEPMNASLMVGFQPHLEYIKTHWNEQSADFKRLNLYVLRYKKVHDGEKTPVSIESALKKTTLSTLCNELGYSGDENSLYNLTVPVLVFIVEEKQPHGVHKEEDRVLEWLVGALDV